MSKLEGLFSELDNGIAELKRAQEKLKVYRQSVLKKAFEGELTKEWRAKQTDLPTGEELLDQIKEERARYHAEQLEEWKTAVKDWESAGKPGKRPPKPRKLDDPDLPSSEHQKRLWSIPNQWAWSQLGWAFFVTKLAGFEYTDHVEYNESGDLKVIKAENAGADGFVPTNYSRVHSSSVSMLKRTVICGGELITAFVGAGTGNVATLPTRQDFFLGPNVAMARPYGHVVVRYVELMLRSPHGKRMMLSSAKAVAQPSLSMGTIRQCPFPICSLAEQEQIVVEIERRFEVSRRLQRDIQEGLIQIDLLRQSILQRAFGGGLLTEKEREDCRREMDWCSASNLLAKMELT